MSQLRIYLLGPPAIYCGDKMVSVPRRQARALLFRLAVRMRPTPREHLCFLFWPNQSETKARRNLTHLLTHLRRALPDCDDVITGDDLVTLNPELVWSDSSEAERRIVHYGQQPHDNALEEVSSLFRGVFMAGFSLPDGAEFENWLLLERTVWERYYLRALELLVESHIDKSMYEHALGYAQRYLAVNHLDEEMHCRLMELYAATGNRAAALQQYRTCADALGRELGIAPLQETKALYLTIMNGSLTPASALEPRHLNMLIPEGHVYPLSPPDVESIESTTQEPALAYAA